jgi:hypothetical protein
MSFDNFSFPTDLIWVVVVPLMFAIAVLFACEALGRIGRPGEKF